MNQMLEKSKLRLLLLKDNQINRQACKHALSEYQNRDCMIFEAETDHQGLKLMPSHQSGYSLLDHHLPVMKKSAELLSELTDPTSEVPVSVIVLARSNNNMVVDSDLKPATPKQLDESLDWDSVHWLQASMVFRALNEAEAKYRTLVEQIPAITYVASLETPGKLLYVSPQICQLGFSAEDWLHDPRGLLKQVHPDDLAITIEAYAHTYEHHAPLRCEYRLVKSDGQARWFLDEANVVRDESGGSLFLQGVLVDITKDKETEQELSYYRQHLEELVAQRTDQLEKQCAILKSANANLDRTLIELRRADANLRASQERFRLLLESAGEGILGLDSEGRCTFVNQTALAMLGYAREEVLDQNARALLCLEDLFSSAEQWRVSTTSRNGVPQRNAAIFLRKDGSSFPVEWSTQAIEIDGQIDGSVLVFWDVTESQALIQNLSFQATHDPLTGLINRTELEQRLTRVLASAHKDLSEHVLCYLDLDYFKNINDTCGHAAGDELLRAIGTLLTTQLRQRDTLARLGGDEFALLLEHTTLEQAWIITNKLCKTIQSFRFTWAGKDYSVSASIGITPLTNADKDIDVVLNAADAACYMAKGNGRNRVHIRKFHVDIRKALKGY